MGHQVGQEEWVRQSCSESVRPQRPVPKTTQLTKRTNANAFDRLKVIPIASHNTEASFKRRCRDQCIRVVACLTRERSGLLVR